LGAMNGDLHDYHDIDLFVEVTTDRGVLVEFSHQIDIPWLLIQLV
jgi:hypothetical protein